MNSQLRSQCSLSCTYTILFSGVLLTFSNTCIIIGPDRVTFVIARIIYSSSPALFLAPTFWEPRDRRNQGSLSELERTPWERGWSGWCPPLRHPEGCQGALRISRKPILRPNEAKRGVILLWTCFYQFGLVDAIA